jgi:hypothetical protein
MWFITYMITPSLRADRKQRVLSDAQKLLACCLLLGGFAALPPTMQNGYAFPFTLLYVL